MQTFILIILSAVPFIIMFFLFYCILKYIHYYYYYFNTKNWYFCSFSFLTKKFQITFELAVKQLMSFDRCEWTQSLMKQYLLVIEGFFTVPLPLFSSTYRRAIQVK